MRLNQTLGDCQAQAHPGGVAIHSDKIFKYFLVMLRGDTWSGVRYADLHTIGSREPETPALLSRRHTGNTACPKMRSRAESNASARGRMFQRIVQQVSRGLLHFLVIKSKCRNGGIKACIQFHAFALKCF